ncbi:MAG: hypothetical protein AAGI30_00435 [Planctomycetota bacterium]
MVPPCEELVREKSQSPIEFLTAGSAHGLAYIKADALRSGDA